MSDYNSSWKRNRSRKPLELDDLKLRLTDAIKQMERIVISDEDDQKKIQASNTLAGLVNRYSRLLEVSDLEERITALEEKHELRKVS